jgi:Ser/Thr protein kinase RdoA (MazF antagonist)
MAARPGSPVMRLSVLRAFVESLRADGVSPLAKAALVSWEHEPGSVRYVRASANAVFTFRSGERELVLRLTPPDSRSPAELAAECAFVEHLVGRGVPVARPVRSVTGALVESVPGSWHAVVFDRLPGAHRELDELPREGFVRWGQALGALHRAAEGWPGRDRPDPILAVPDGEDTARRAMDAVIARLAELPEDEGSFGMIHGDFELDNVLWPAGSERVTGIVDLDGCARHWYAADVAFALRDLFGDRVSGIDLHDARLRLFLDGYRAARPLPDAEAQLLPLFLRLHQLTTFTALLHTVDVPDDGTLPPWLDNLRSKLLAKLDFYRHEFASAPDA